MAPSELDPESAQALAFVVRVLRNVSIAMDPRSPIAPRWAYSPEFQNYSAWISRSRYSWSPPQATLRSEQQAGPRCRLPTLALIELSPEPGPANPAAATGIVDRDGVCQAMGLARGALGDRYGRRRLFVLGLAGFGVGSVAPGCSPARSSFSSC